MVKKKGKGGPVTKAKKALITAKLKDLIQSSSINNTDYTSLARVFKTTRNTISKYVDEIYVNTPPEEINRVMLDFRFTFDKLEREVNTALRNAETAKEKMDAIKTYFQFIKEKTDYLEKFFIKEKVADKIDLTADITQKQIIVNVNMSNGAAESNN